MSTNKRTMLDNSSAVHCFRICVPASKLPLFPVLIKRLVLPISGARVVLCQCSKPPARFPVNTFLYKSALSSTYHQSKESHSSTKILPHT